MKNPYDIIIKQIITEKTTKLAEQNKYTFEVSKGSNKIEIKNAILEIFKSKNIKVESVKIINVRKKPHKMGRYEGYLPAVHKAIVTLAAGSTLDVFEI
ncbi:MAG: 50S ribosomal protein L23 [Coprobacillus sp.]|nr:50S ribosomal protein L23 [Coprobacillus sp.]MDY4145923.1 50S ribosomal protein L23 [Bacilli bacterium]OLA10774.1 MAG: 50S ribosomal protein L23 [Coprobacillus sp. 28_7]CCY08425.1 50S ribosomal protein L23 [Coprobacillus sp. CAG:698]